MNTLLLLVQVSLDLNIIFLGRLITYKMITNNIYKGCLAALSLMALGACNDENDVLEEYDVLPEEVVVVDLVSGSADFSKTVSVGASFTAGFTDNALFIAAQENSFPNL